MKKIKVLLLFLSMFCVFSITKSVEAKCSTDIKVVDVYYDNALCDWAFKLESVSGNDIYYSFTNDVSKSSDHIKSGETIVVNASIIDGSLKRMKACTYDKKGNRSIVNRIFTYDLAEEKFHKDIINVISKLKEDNPDILKAYLLYEFVVRNSTYEYDSHTNNKYNAFYNKNAACSGFSSLYEYLCKSIRLKCEYVSDQVVDYKYMPWHAWNHLTINGELYLVDTTYGIVASTENNMDYSHFCNNSVIVDLCNTRYNFSTLKAVE